MTGKSSGSMLIGKGGHLRGTTDHTVNIADHIDHRFDLGSFVDAACWLNDNVGQKNWCYDGMTYYFNDRDNLVNFKLRYLFDAQ